MSPLKGRTLKEHSEMWEVPQERGISWEPRKKSVVNNEDTSCVKCSRQLSEIRKGISHPVWLLQDNYFGNTISASQPG